MAKVIEDIPLHLQPAANAALAWMNQKDHANYKLTGLIDPDLAWRPRDEVPTDMALVLCDDGACSRQAVRIQWQGETFNIAAIDAEDSLIPPHLDPPANTRKGWLEGQLQKHEFTVLVFYRGFW